MTGYKQAYMAALRERLREEGRQANLLPFEEIPLTGLGDPSDYQWDAREYHIRAAYVASHAWNETDKKLKGGRLALLAKRIIRKLVRFYVKPIAEEQNDYNENMARAVLMLGDYVEKLPQADDLAELVTQARQAILQEKQLRVELDALTRQVSALTGDGKGGTRCE